MNRFFRFTTAAALGVILAALFISCAGEPSGYVSALPETSETAEAPRPYIITDYKNKAPGTDMPEWVSRYYGEGAAGIETMESYADRYVFVSRNEGNNFNALNQWIRGFDAELDFPRLAAARIETRLSSGVPSPDYTYGAFYEALIRAASDAVWAGAVKEDDFWVLREFFPGGEDEESSAGMPDNESPPAETENWEFLILVSVEKNTFVSRFDEIFKNVDSGTRLSKDQAAAAGRVRERFFDGF